MRTINTETKSKNISTEFPMPFPTSEVERSPQGISNSSGPSRKNISEPKTKRKLLIILFFLGILSLVSVFLFINSKKPTLTVNVSPEEALITVNEKYSSFTKFEKKLPKGFYKIAVSKENYLTEVREIDLSENLVLNISLEQETTLSDLKTIAIKSISPHSTANFSLLDKDSLMGIDQTTSFLIKIMPTFTTTIYSTPVESYSFTPPIVALLERSNSEKIIILNIKTNESRSISAENLSQIISVSLSSDLETIFILGNYSPETRNSKLYVSDLENFSPKEVFSTKANHIESLSSTQIAFFESSDALDKGLFSILDLQQNKIVYSRIGNNFLISPSYSSAAIQSSKSISIVNLKTLFNRTVSLSDSNKIAWKDDSTIIIAKNKNPGVEISYLSLESLKTTSPVSIESLTQNSVKTIIGVIGDFLIIEDTEGKLFQITLP